MKKKLCLLFAISFVFIAINANASTSVKRNAFEFCDLYLMRLQELKESFGIDAVHDMEFGGLYSATPYTNFLNEDGQYSCQVPAGNIVVSMPGFEIEKAYCVLMDMNKGSSENGVSIYRSAMMYAALEYDSSRDYYYSSLGKINDSYQTNVIEKAFNEFKNAVSACFDDPKKTDLLSGSSGTRIQIISKNYEYSLCSYIGDHDGKPLHYLFLEAIAK